MALDASNITDAIGELTSDKAAFDAAKTVQQQKGDELTAAELAKDVADGAVEAAETDLRTDVEAVKHLIDLTFLPATPPQPPQPPVA